ncbi:YobI family P-loop NTPase [Photobacterium leiognathi]|uniref:YobI family P-loop NTPase n=1 Tax=Photobacterium leiognathi TaxID=553611 RepID=UPI002980D681|nr:ATP-binding protein [Photobacterium leiognathi]
MKNINQTSSVGRFKSLFKRWNSKKETGTQFVDLAATDGADDCGKYSEAIEYALTRPDVFNIAITGPYGSGKSSVIKAFLKSSKHEALQISLATFASASSTDNDSDEPSDSASNGSTINRQDVERSILQQMVYKENARAIPLSRFKRIESPTYLGLKSLYLTVGGLSSYYIYNHISDITKGSFLKPLNLISDISKGSFFNPSTLSNALDIGIFAFTVCFIWSLVRILYGKSFGLSLKGLSLKNIEIKPSSDDESSILNRHLDEIIYFFQKTKYDLVIIEDLDRFNDHEVFITLREINTLINNNSDIKKRVRFIYALRDDMFESTDRTKFFEFIVPIIPIVNSSNAIDKVLEHTKRIGIQEKLNDQFLREISRYLDDLRLIRNVFNEYVIYQSRLDDQSVGALDLNKLLAVLIYKNVYPSDFELLHRNGGILADILNLRNELTTKLETEYDQKIEQIENDIAIIDEQLPVNIQELNSIYIMAILEHFPGGIELLQDYQGRWYPLDHYKNSDDSLRRLLSSTYIIALDGGRHERRINLKNLKKCYSLDTYKKRYALIENKSTGKKEECLQNLRESREERAALRKVKLREILRHDYEKLNEFFSKLKGNSDLARYLILEGYLDDSYYQYTSLFHAGRLSPSDNAFLRKIRAFNTPEPTFQIDNPKEVIADMREEDFGQEYVLNITIIDTLCSNSSLYTKQLTMMNEFIIKSFAKIEDSIIAYYDAGGQVGCLVRQLIDDYPSFVLKATEGKYAYKHAALILTHLESNKLEKLNGETSRFKDYLSSNLKEVLNEAPELDAEKLIVSNVNVKDLSSIHEHKNIASKLVEEGKFEINTFNIEYIIKDLLNTGSKSDIETKNYTTILNSGSHELINKINSNFDTYLIDVLNKLEQNNQEDPDTIVNLLNKTDVDIELVKSVVVHQTLKIPHLEAIPKTLWTFAISNNLIEPSLDNCMSYLGEDEYYDKDELLKFLNRPNVYSALSSKQLPEKGTEALEALIVNAKELNDDAYQAYLSVFFYSYPDLPEGFSDEKKLIMINADVLCLTVANLNALSGNEGLWLPFITRNIDEFIQKIDDFRVDNLTYVELLSQEISIEHKVEIVKAIDISIIESETHSETMALIASIIMNEQCKSSDLSSELIIGIINELNSAEDLTDLLIKFGEQLSQDELRNVIRLIGGKFEDIVTKSSGGRVTLENTHENEKLVELLKTKDIISSYSKSSYEIRVNLKRKSQYIVS